MVGALLGQRYELVELVGKGGMADVYKAKCTLLNRNVAIKVLRDEFKNDEEFLKRFKVESQAAAGLSHNNIVSVYDVGSQGEIQYIVMEYVEGITLKEYLKKYGPLSWEKAVNFASQIASALQHAHRKGIVHRDIKPQNILVTKDEVLKVTDFGIARAASSVTMKVDDNSMGTVHYCSPEQARGGYTDEKSDIYSLGVVMYEMVTGKLPFEGDSSVSVALKHIQEEPVSPRLLVPNLPEDVEAIILRAMKKEQSERFSTASEMLIELSMVKHGKGYTAPEPIARDDDSATKVFSAKEVQKAAQAMEKEEKMKESTRKKGKKTKGDAVAVWSAVGAAFLFVFILTGLVVALIFPNSMPWSCAAEEVVVPDLLGYDYERAVEDYPNYKIVIEREEASDKDAGIILEQTPSKDSVIKSNQKIKVVVSKGKEPVAVPNLKNYEYREAIIKLDEIGVDYTLSYEESATVPADTVISMSPSAGSKVTPGKDVVTLVVSSGDTAAKVVPNVVGSTETEAKKALDNAGFGYRTVETNSTKEKGIVVHQSVTGQVAEKVTVVLQISNGKAPEEEPENPGTTTPPASTTTPSAPSTTDTTTDKPNSGHTVVDSWF